MDVPEFRPEISSIQRPCSLTAAVGGRSCAAVTGAVCPLSLSN